MTRNRDRRTDRAHFREAHDIDLAMAGAHSIRLARRGAISFGTGATISEVLAWEAMTEGRDIRAGFWHAWHTSRMGGMSLKAYLKGWGDEAERAMVSAAFTGSARHAADAYIWRARNRPSVAAGVHWGTGYYADWRDNLRNRDLRAQTHFSSLAARHAVALARFDAPGYNTTVGVGGRLKVFLQGGEKGGSAATPVGAWVGGADRQFDQQRGSIIEASVHLTIPANWRENVLRRGLAIQRVEGRTTFVLKALDPRCNRRTGEAIPARIIALRQYPHCRLRVEHATARRSPDGSRWVWAEPPALPPVQSDAQRAFLGVPVWSNRQETEHSSVLEFYGKRKVGSVGDD